MAIDRTCGGQFALIPAKVLYDDSLPATAKLLYGEIYRLSSAMGYCYATNKEFQRILRCSEGTVTNLISALKEQKHIRVKLIRRKGATGDIVQRRIFCGQELAVEDPPEDVPGTSQEVPQKIGVPSPKNLGDRPPKTCGPTIKKENKRNTPISPEVLERISGYAGDDAELKDAILGLIENRQAMGAAKAVKTARAMNGILRELDKLSGGGRELKLRLLDKATTSNWLTVYPLKGEELPETVRSQVVEEKGVRYI